MINIYGMYTLFSAVVNFAEGFLPSCAIRVVIPIILVFIAKLDQTRLNGGIQFQLDHYDMLMSSDV